MVTAVRNQYNKEFTPQKYNDFVTELGNVYPGHLDFRVAETPVFIPKEFTEKMMQTCNNIVQIISSSDYKKESDKAIPPPLMVPNENEKPHFIAFDFAICKNESGELEPQLIELQGFPSLFLFQVLMAEVSSHHFNWPENYSPYLSGLDKESYIDLLKKIIIGDCKPENVILLEIKPHQQKTRIDFYATQTYLGIKAVCLTEIIQEGKDIFYTHNGIKTPVYRIFNRVIFDELLQQPAEIQEKGSIFWNEINATWISHPNWFYRISKFTLPYIKDRYVPFTQFLNTIKEWPQNLEDYVVKPLFSFAGQGVIIDVTKEALDNIEDPQNWIIQKKVDYANAIVTPHDTAKAEIRLFYFWEEGAPQPIAANNLARLSKGKMIGVRYNKDKDWVGGSFALFEK